jgi:WXG100 family type VII secretion target
MMTQGQFDTAEIASHASLTQQRADELEQAITALRSAASQLAAVWTGPGASSFQSMRDQWERSVVPLQESLAGMSSALGQTGTAYESNESSISRAFGG